MVLVKDLLFKDPGGRKVSDPQDCFKNMIFLPDDRVVRYSLKEEDHSGL